MEEKLLTSLTALRRKCFHFSDQRRRSPRAGLTRKLNEIKGSKRFRRFLKGQMSFDLKQLKYTLLRCIAAGLKITDIDKCRRTK